MRTILITPILLLGCSLLAGDLAPEGRLFHQPGNEAQEMADIERTSRQDDIAIAKKEESHRVAHRAERGMWLPCMYDFQGGSMFLYMLVAYYGVLFLIFVLLAKEETRVIGIALLLAWLVFCWNRYDEVWMIGVAIPIGLFFGSLKAIVSNWSN